MILDDVAGLWWENITGPQMLVESIVSSLSEGKSVVLQSGHAIPWPEQMRDIVAHCIDQVQLRPLHWEGGKTQNDIVPYLLKRLCRSGSSRCPMDYNAQLAYLKNEHIFANTVVWLLSADTGEQASLLHFLSDYRGKSLENHGAFVLEILEGQSIPPLSDSTAILRCVDYIRDSDLLIYASILAGRDRKEPGLNAYISCAAADLAGQNAELIPDILREIDFRKEDPGQALIRLWNEGRIPCPHDRPDEQQLQMCVWKAQLQTVFPLIEMERLRITSENRERINQSLETEYWNPRPVQWQVGFIQQRGDEVDSATDLELGTLVRMMSLRRNDDRTVPLLSFPDQQLRQWIIFLTDCRNNLAHHRVCTPEQMYDLLCSTENR